MSDPESSASTGVLARLEWIFRNVVHFLIILTPLIAAVLTDRAWRLSDLVQGSTMIGLAALFAAVAAYIASIDRDQFAHTHWLAVGGLVTVGSALILDGDALIVGLALEMIILHVLARRLEDRWPLAGGHFLAAILIFWMSMRLDHSGSAPALINMTAQSDLLVIAAVAAASFAIKEIKVGLIYRALSYIAVLAWLSRELEGFDNGQAFVTVAWSICGIALLVAGLKGANADLRRVGLITLGLVVAKLFLVDLAELDPIWRILLFMGVGAGFLLLGWFVPGLWGREETARRY